MKDISNYNLLKNSNRGYSNIYEYRRAAYIHRTAVVKRERMILIVIFCLAVIITSFIFTGKVYAHNNSSASDSVKMYKSITIYAGDTLESIAAEYMSEEYSSVVKYVNEVSAINGINSDSALTPGNNIIIPYYMSKSISNNPVIEISLAN